MAHHYVTVDLKIMEHIARTNRLKRFIQSMDCDEWYLVHKTRCVIKALASLSFFV